MGVLELLLIICIGNEYLLLDFTIVIGIRMVLLPQVRVGSNHDCLGCDKDGIRALPSQTSLYQSRCIRALQNGLETSVLFLRRLQGFRKIIFFLSFICALTGFQLVFDDQNWYLIQSLLFSNGEYSFHQSINNTRTDHCGCIFGRPRVRGRTRRGGCRDEAQIVKGPKNKNSLYPSLQKNALNLFRTKHLSLRRRIWQLKRI